MAPTPAIVVAIAIALFKGTLVAMFLMHLRSERAMIYWPLALAAFLCVALIAFVLWAEADHLFGTRFTGAFEGGTE
jgi:caa(3)-type oxidase subunit IV